MRDVRFFSGVAPVTTAAAWLLSAVSIGLLLLILERCQHGFDFSDEGLYLNAIAHPWLYTSGVTQYALIYKPLMILSGNDVALLRQFNVLVTWTLAFLVAWICVAKRCRPDAVEFAAILSIATASHFYHASSWLPTPSYNSLALQGLLIVAFGLISASIATEARRRLIETIPALIIGFGGGITFLAKPTSAALLAAVVAPVAVVLFQQRLAMLLVAMATAVLVIVSAGFMLDGPARLAAPRLEPCQNGGRGGKKRRPRQTGFQRFFERKALQNEKEHASHRGVLHHAHDRARTPKRI